VQRLCEKAKAEGYRIRQIVLATGPIGRADLEAADELILPGKELVVSEDLDDITRAIGESTALASMKFHGTVVATAYGIPSIVLSPTDKSRNLYRMIGQERLLSHLAHKDLPDKLAEVAKPISRETSADLKDRSRVVIDDMVSMLAEVAVQQRRPRLLAALRR
jgi:polysaccharide pyruvyl transferase WcaK-like protein